MQISFFEEFPTKENLSKTKHLQWPTKLYIAAPSLEAFKSIKQKIKNKKITETIYWPVLNQKEGYWISPFAGPKALLRIFKELQNQTIPVMLDLELPHYRKLGLYLKAFSNFKTNKRLIQNFIINYPGQIYLAEYFIEGKLKNKLLRELGLHYDDNKIKIIKMMYHSVHNFTEDSMRARCLEGQKQHGDNFCVALGTIATGIKGDEPVLSAEQLKKDLEIVKNSGVKESIIFRLGGMNKNYSKCISEVVES